MARPTVARAVPVQYPSNGHYYEAVGVTGLSWFEAERAARRRKYHDMAGHLATVTSPAENQFVADHFHTATRNGYWLGGFQSHGLLDPSTGWQWVTGEPWSYTNWSDLDVSEPNDSWGPGTENDDEDSLQFWPGAGGRWNDARSFDTDYAYGYLVEYEPDPSPDAPVITGYTAADRSVEQLTGGPPGGMLRITGTNLGESGTVLFIDDLIPTTVASWSPAEILVWVPSAPSYPLQSSVTLVANGKKAKGPAFTITAPTPETDNLLANGSFEFPSSASSPVDWGYTYGLPLDPDPTFYRGPSIPGWRIPRGTIDVKLIYWQRSPDKGQSIDLVGSPGAALIEQTFFTEAGKEYILSGWMSHNPGIPSGKADVYLNAVLFKHLSHTAATSNSQMRWTQFTYRFRASQPQTTLSILDVSRYSIDAGMALDGVSVTLAPG
jgi:hypothetical protein